MAANESAWREYQESVARFFRSLGFDATTDETVVGARAEHAVDVVVRGQLSGIPTLWIVECKAWKRKVPKERVGTLRNVVDDVGADRGFLMAEGGYQPGALRAARLTNLTLTSLADLRETLAYDIAMAHLQRLRPRLYDCRTRYWDIDKETRIRLGLRADVMQIGYSGNTVVQAVDVALDFVLRAEFPFRYDQIYAANSSSNSRDLLPADAAFGLLIEDPRAMFEHLNASLAQLEGKLDHAEAVILQERSAAAGSGGHPPESKR